MTSYPKVDVQTPAPDWPGYVWRPERREDIPNVHRLLQAVEQADDRMLAGSLEDAEREFDDPWFDAENGSLLAIAPGGQVAAFAWTFLDPKPRDEAQCYLWIEVHPEHRLKISDEALLDWAEACGRRRLAQIAPAGVPRDLRIGLDEKQRDRVALIERRGYQPLRSFYRMRRDLGSPIPEVSLPEGLVLRTYTPDMSRALLDAFNDTFQDHWNFHPIDEDDWERFFMQRSSFRPDLSFLVMDGDRIAGYSVNRVSPEDNAQQGFNAGHVGQVGVRREYRKKGIATALLCASMRAFKAESLDYATLGVDAENLTGALKIYERVGFAVYKRFVQFAKSIP
jgi:mycothiol synthase